MFTPRPLRRNLQAALRDLGSSRPQVRASAARDLGISGQDAPDVAAEALQPLLRDASAEVRKESALALGAIGSRGCVAEVVRLLDDPESDVRQHAAIALGQIGGESATSALERAFESGRPDVQFQSLLALAASNATSAVRVCHEALGRDDVWIASEAALQLARVLTSQDDSAREWTTEADRARAREALRGRVGPATGRVALCASIALARLGDDRGIDTITKFLAGALDFEVSDDVEELRIEAIECIDAGGGSGIVDALSAIAWRVFPSAERDAARGALARLGDARARNEILESLRSRSESKRHAGIYLAGWGRVRDAVPELQAILREGSVDRVFVIDALERIGDDTARSALADIARDDRDDDARLAASAAIARMATKASSS